EGKKPSECVKEGHCRALQVSFFECKRSMVVGHQVAIPGKKGLLMRTPRYQRESPWTGAHSL
ncbi:hypothetical protein Z043_125508, partial [Scleropages formosus]